MRKRFQMGLRSLNPAQLVIELVVVFLGVYLAFLFSSFRANAERLKETEKAIELIEIGIDRYEMLFEQFIIGHQNRNTAFRESLAKNEIPKL